MLLLGGASVLLAGCGGGSDGGSSGAPATTAVAAVPAGNRITAAESEYKIVLSRSTVPAGTYRIEAVNEGTITHALEINGPNVSGMQSTPILPGNSMVLTVALSKGSYDIFCPIPGHKALGMNTTLKVT